ncbi:MAG: SPOR domain-containing protein [Gammaproteobacteria bacterium]
MPKDYAKNIFTNKRKSKPREWRSPIFLLFVLGLVISGIVFYAMRLHNDNTAVASNNYMTSWFANAKSLLKNKHVTPVKAAKQALTKDEGVHFDFYTELPKMQVNMPMADEPKAPETVKSLPPIELGNQIDESIRSAISQNKQAVVQQYILELGVFNDKSSAAQLRLSLLLAGVESEVVQPEENGAQFRVQKLFTNESSAKQMQKRLQKKGIESVLRKLG